MTKLQPYFKKYSRYSKKQPVPQLGDASTNDNSVLKFYKFWQKFDSWRDFTHELPEGEAHDLNTAENRYERKWMIKENKAMTQPFKKEESIKIQQVCFYFFIFILFCLSFLHHVCI